MRVGEQKRRNGARHQSCLQGVEEHRDPYESNLDQLRRSGYDPSDLVEDSFGKVDNGTYLLHFDQTYHER